MNTGGAFQESVGLVVHMTNNLYLMPRLRVCGAIPLFPPYVFMAREGSNSPLKYSELIKNLYSAFNF